MKIKEKLSEIPLAVNTVALGTMGISASLTCLTTEVYKSANKMNLPMSGLYSLLGIHIFCICVCIFYLTLLAIKLSIVGFQKFKEDLVNPELTGPLAVTLLDFCTLTNSFGWIYTNFITDSKTQWGLLLSVNIYTVIVVFFQITYFILFIKHIWFKKASWTGEIFASWFVPLIGVSITPGYINNLGDILPALFWQIEWFIGFTTFAIMYPLVLYKFLFQPHTHKKNIPSMAIYASPANMLSIGFLYAFDPHRLDHGYKSQSALNNEIFYQVFAIMMFCWAALSVCLYLIIFAKAMMLPKYSYSWGALTFPSSISATGNALYTHYLFINSHIAIYWTAIAFSVFLLTLSFIITVFVNVKYARELNRIFRGKVHLNNNNNQHNTPDLDSQIITNVIPSLFEK